MLWLPRFRKVLISWEGTPYGEGYPLKLVRVDCVHFVCAVLDEMRGYRTELPENLPSDRSLHDRDSAITAMRTLIRLYEPVEDVVDEKIEPGDIAVSGPLGGGPGHALIAGFDPGTFWHVDPNAGVCYTGLGITEHEIYGIYRTDKSEWESKGYTSPAP